MQVRNVDLVSEVFFFPKERRRKESATAFYSLRSVLCCAVLCCAALEFLFFFSLPAYADCSVADWLTGGKYTGKVGK